MNELFNRLHWRFPCVCCTVFSLLSLSNIAKHSETPPLYEEPSDRNLLVERVQRPEMKNTFCSPNCLFQMSVFLMWSSSAKLPILSHVQNLKIDTETLSECNQVPLRRARGVLPFCLKQRKSNFPLRWKQSPSWLTSCWKKEAFGLQTFFLLTHTQTRFNAPVHFHTEHFLILFLRTYRSHCASNVAHAH